MADYGLKYRAEFKNTRGHEYQLDIYQRSFNGTTKTIKTLCGCVLEIQGAQGDVTAPIVKTQLRFSLVDAWDIADTNNAKWGNWSEFYTPDATLYKVQLRSMSGSSTSPIWTGYITPDSWQEELGYRTAITITARDNVGHLKDFPFQATGLVTPDSNGLIEVRYIFGQAMNIIDFPMLFSVESWGSGQYSADVPCTDDGDYLTEASVNAKLFDGMNWYDVLERTLEATGYAFRYVGGNTCVICCLRNLPKVGHYSSETPSQTLEFYGGSLEFEPAVKQIEENVDFKFKEEVALEALGSFQFTTGSAYRCVVEGNGSAAPVAIHSAPLDVLTSPGNSVWDNGSEMFNPSTREPDDYLINSEGADGWKQYAMIPGNRDTDDPSTSFRFHAKTAAVRISVNFAPFPVGIIDSGANTGKITALQYSLSQIKYQVSFVSEDGNTIRYWSGDGWATDHEHTITRDYDSENEYGTTLDINLAECKAIMSGFLVITFSNIIYKRWDDSGTGVYARVQSILVGLFSTRAVDSDKVTTINNTDYNINVDRSPLFGALSREVGFVKPENYLAGLFYYPYSGSPAEQFPYQVRFTDQGATVPLPVLIHQQILCYRHGAARVLSGRCAPVNKVAFDLGSLFSYKGTTYLLQGGTLDLFSGIMEGAVLHEFVDFNELWTGTPTYSGDSTYNTNTPGTGYSGGNSGGAPPATYTLPIASANELGGVKVGNGLSIDQNGVLSANGGSSASFGSYNASRKTVMLTVNGSTREMQQYPGQKYIFPAVLAAPIIEIRHGFTKNSPQSAIDPILYARHPAIGGITGAQLVLMTYSQRRGRNGRKNYREGCFARKGWGAAQGKTNHAGLTWTTNAKTLLDIRQFILRNFIAIAGEAKPSSMTYAAFQAKSDSAKIGFSGMYNTAAATFKSKNRRRFGIAVRWENPDWTALGLTGTIADTTTEYNNNGTRVRRWIYTDVAEFIVHVGYAYTNNAGLAKGWVIGFELKK